MVPHLQPSRQAMVGQLEAMVSMRYEFVKLKNCELFFQPEFGKFTMLSS